MVFPFAKFHSRGERPTEVRYVPPQAFTRCGLAWDKARQGWAGEKSGLFEHPVKVALLFQMCTVEVLLC